MYLHGVIYISCKNELRDSQTSLCTFKALDEEKQHLYLAADLPLNILKFTFDTFYTGRFKFTAMAYGRETRHERKGLSSQHNIVAY